MYLPIALNCPGIDQLFPSKSLDFASSIYAQSLHEHAAAAKKQRIFGDLG